MNLFLSTSPLQLICCMEAKKHYSTKNNILILRDEKTKIGQKQVNKLLDEKEWDVIIRLKRSNKIWQTTNIIRRLKKINPSLVFDNFFFADYMAWRTNVVLANITAKNEVMLDDGTNTITTFKSFIETGQHVSRNKPSRDFLMSLLGITKARIIYPRDNFHLFTFFNLKSGKFQIQKNDFGVLRSKLNALAAYSPNAPVGFIGQGLVGSRGIKVDDYLSLLKTLVKENPQGILYFPHRSETEEVSEKIKKINGITYQKATRPIEFEIAEENIKLSAIYGVSSAASYTLSQIYSNIPVFDIKVPLEKYGMAQLGKTLEGLRQEMGLPYADIPEW